MSIKRISEFGLSLALSLSSLLVVAVPKAYATSTNLVSNHMSANSLDLLVFSLVSSVLLSALIFNRYSSNFQK